MDNTIHVKSAAKRWYKLIKNEHWNVLTKIQPQFNLNIYNPSITINPMTDFVQAFHDSNSVNDNLVCTHCHQTFLKQFCTKTFIAVLTSSIFWICSFKLSISFKRPVCSLNVSFKVSDTLSGACLAHSMAVAFHLKYESANKNCKWPVCSWNIAFEVSQRLA